MTVLNIINLFCGMGGDELGIRDAVYTDLKMKYKVLSALRIIRHEAIKARTEYVKGAFA